MVAKQEKVLSPEILLPGLLDWIDFGDKWGNIKADGFFSFFNFNYKEEKVQGVVSFYSDGLWSGTRLSE